MGNKKKWIKGNEMYNSTSGNTCMLCLEKQNRVFDVHKKIADTIQEILTIKVDNVIKLPKRVCYRCYFIIEYMRDFRNVTIRNITVAENKLTHESSIIVYDRPLIFNIITEKVLKEENIPYNLEMAEYTPRELEEKTKEKEAQLLIPQSYRDVSYYEQDTLPYQQTIFHCKYCIRTYNKKTSLIHHERKHLREERKSRCRSAQSNRSRTYACDSCDDETVFTTVTELRKHKKLHSRTYACRMGCDENFNATFERDFHEARCSKRFSAEEFEQPGVRTRSRSRLGSIERSRCSSRNSIASSIDGDQRSRSRNSEQDDNWDSVSTNFGRRSVSNDSLANTKNQRKSKQNDSQLIRSPAVGTRRRGRPRTRTQCDNKTKNAQTQKKVKEKKKPNNVVEKEPQVEASSSSASGFTNHTPVVAYYAPINVVDPIGYQPASIDDSISFLRTTRRERNNENEIVHLCIQKNCKFFAKTVDEVSQHETSKHNIQPWFPCELCKKAYTNKKLLDYHKQISHRVGGPYICCICTEIHLTQHDLRIHLLKHRITNNIECHGCDKQFLTYDSLQVHLAGETDYRHKHLKKVVRTRKTNSELTGSTSTDTNTDNNLPVFLNQQNNMPFNQENSSAILQHHSNSLSFNNNVYSASTGNFVYSANDENSSAILHHPNNSVSFNNHMYNDSANDDDNSSVSPPFKIVDVCSLSGSRSTTPFPTLDVNDEMDEDFDDDSSIYDVVNENEDITD